MLKFIFNFIIASSMIFWILAYMAKSYEVNELREQLIQCQSEKSSCLRNKNIYQRMLGVKIQEVIAH